MPHHIAIVEDEPAIAANYRDTLQRQGFTVSLYNTREKATAAFDIKLPDLAIIDIGLGDDIEGGFELCRDLRSRAPELPIIATRSPGFTARSTDSSTATRSRPSLKVLFRLWQATTGVAVDGCCCMVLFISKRLCRLHP